MQPLPESDPSDRPTTGLPSAGWSVAEIADTPKSPGAGEDRLVVREDRHGDLALLAVIDGATDKGSGRLYGDRIGGALAADSVADTLRSIPLTATSVDMVAAVTRDLAQMRRIWAIGADDLLAPSTVAAILLPRQGVLVRVGDVHLALRRAGQWQHFPAHKRIDTVAADFRAAYLAALLESGVPLEELAETDPGRAAVLPLLVQQGIFANHPDHPLAFGVLNGRAVPPQHIETIHVGDDVEEIVVASDGYLGPDPTLDLAESRLCASLLDDPLRIGEHRATKGVRPGAAGFDDRTYARLTRSARPTLDRDAAAAAPAQVSA
ncbi:hypothetical protein ACI1MP_10480 [Kitasatospora griseola]|uniref:hypothetical protein n=1 Tax=Kitasatospora griseola TaxID=2064 RepID=UPI003855F2B8